MPLANLSVFFLTAGRFVLIRRSEMKRPAKKMPSLASATRTSVSWATVSLPLPPNCWIMPRAAKEMMSSMTPAAITAVPTSVSSMPSSIRIIELTGTAVMEMVRPTVSEATSPMPNILASSIPSANGMMNETVDMVRPRLPAATIWPASPRAR
jgi:hypothetical protein